MSGDGLIPVGDEQLAGTEEDEWQPEDGPRPVEWLRWFREECERQNRMDLWQEITHEREASEEGW